MITSLESGCISISLHNNKNNSVGGLVSSFKMPTSRRPDHHPTKSSLLSTLSFAALLFIILLASSIFCNFSIQTVVLDTQILSTTNNRRLPLSSILSVAETSIIKDPTSTAPPINVTEEERIAWFRNQLPNIEIFKSTDATQMFRERAQMFLERGCDIQVFMTWISPVTSFGQRELLSMESLFNAHPNGCLMILSQTMDSKAGNEILKPLIESGFKILTVAPDLPFLFKKTPAETWFNEMKMGIKDPGEIPLAQNLSNLLRLAVLYKYGGVYLDTDFIVIKKLSGLTNTIGAQSMNADSGNWSRLNNAVLIFDKHHPLVFKFIEEFSLTFDGNKWGHNGPYLVSRVVERVRYRPGYTVTVLPPMAFYPVNWNKVEGFFQKPKTMAQSRWVLAKLLQLSGDTYGVHLWNKQSNRLRIEEGSIMAYLISKHCVFSKHVYSS